MNYKNKYIDFKKLLNKFKRVTIISHKRPDGDTISSALAMHNYLKDIGVTSEWVCIDTPPQKFSFLNGFDRYKSKIGYSDSLIITLDCANINRCGFELEGSEIINIDHHQDNSNFGNLNIVEVDVSTTAVLYKLLKEGQKLSKKVVEALYTGLISDSQNFTTTLTSNNTFNIAKELINLGANPSLIATKVNKSNSLAHIRILGRAINSLELHIDGRVAFMQINKDDINATGASFADINGVIDMAISLVTVEVAILLVEYQNSIKGSIRSKNEDISKVASLFGGGGHKNASGFEVKGGKIAEIKDLLLKRIKGIIYV